MKTLLLLSVGMLLAGADAPQPTVTVDGGTAVDLCACPDPKIRLSVTPTNGFKAAGDPLVAEVSVGNLRDASLVNAFHAAWTENGTVLTLTADPQKLIKSATYNVVLKLLPSSAVSPKLTLQATHQPGQLQVPSKLIIRRESGLGSTLDMAKLKFTEQSWKTDITGLKASEPQQAVLGNDPVTGRLEFNTIPTVPAGMTIDVPYELGGNFPLGTVTGTTQLISPQLTQPVALNWELRTARPVWWIALYALAGALLSWLLKTYLQNRIQLEEARVKAEDLIARVDADRDRHLDPDFRAAIDLALADLKIADRKSDAADIDAKRQTLDQKWREALQALATRRQTLQASIDEIKSLVGTLWQAPATLIGEIARAKTSLEALDPKLKVDDLAGATADLNGTRRNLGLVLRADAVAWQQRIADYYEALLAPGGGLSTSIKAGLKTAVDKVSSALATIKDDTAAATVQDMTQLLGVMSIELRQAREPLNVLKTKMQIEIEKAEQDLAAVKVSIEPLKKAVVEFASAQPAVVDDPAPALDGLPAQLRHLDEAWREALEKAFSGKLPKAVEDTLKAQDYPGAVAAAVVGLQGGALLGGAFQIAPGADDWTQSMLLGAGPPSIVVARSSVFGFELPVPGSRLALRTAQQLIVDKSIQSAILFVLVAIGALSMYHASFVGNWDDFFKIFFYAFGLDITVDAVRQALKPKTT